MLDKIKGYKTVIVMAAVFIAALLRPKHPEIPGEAEVTGMVDKILDAIFGVPGTSALAIIMRFFSTTKIGKSA